MSEQSELLRKSLKSLQSEADHILDQIDQTEAEILQLEHEEDQLFLSKRKEILQELTDILDECNKIYYIDEKDEYLIYLCENLSGKSLAVFLDEDRNIDSLRQWVQTQIKNLHFYDLLMKSAGRKDLIPASVGTVAGASLNEHNLLEFSYDSETDKVEILHHRILTEKEVYHCLLDKYRDADVIVESDLDEEYFDEDSDYSLKSVTVCDLSELVSTVKRIKESINA